MKPTDLGKLSDVLKSEVVKKDAYDELVKIVNVIDNNRLVKMENMMLRSIRLKVKYLLLLA